LTEGWERRNLGLDPMEAKMVGHSMKVAGAAAAGEGSWALAVLICLRFPRCAAESQNSSEHTNENGNHHV
jgi:hypothetical protein